MALNPRQTSLALVVAVAVGLTVAIGLLGTEPDADYSLPGVDPAPAVAAYTERTRPDPGEEPVASAAPITAVPASSAPSSTGVSSQTTTPSSTALPDDPSLDSGAEALKEAIQAGHPDWVGVMTLTGADSEIDRYAAVIGRQPDLVQVAIGWESDRFNQSLLDRVADRGSVLMISWEPWDHRQKVEPAEQPKFALRNILSGQFDDYIDEWARGLAADGRPVLLRFAHEMNGVWYPWNEYVNGNPAGSYVEAWKYVRGRVLAAGATNVVWVWSPNTSYFGAPDLAPLYPGDSEVDIVGLVGYFGHFNTVPEHFPVFSELFGETIDEIREFDQSPILITETGSTEEGGFKPDWIDDFLDTVAERDDITGFVWFDVDKEADWSISSSPESELAFVEGLADPVFGG